MKDLENFKILQIGLGSMGKRRIRNFLYHGFKKENIVGFDPRKDRRSEANSKYGIKVYNSFQKAVTEHKPDIFIVSTPPDTHYKYFLYAAKNRKHLFVEHPVTEKGYTELARLENKNFVAAPSCTLRFHPAVKAIKKALDEGKVGKILSFQYHLGQYLPLWHPWEDFKDVYFSKKFTGACREMFGFELVWLVFALNLGEVSKIVGFTEKLSNLKMTADDRYSALLKFKNGISGNIVIDLISKKYFRTLRIIGSEGVLEWEMQDNQIRIFNEKNISNNSDQKWKVIEIKKGKREKDYVPTEDMYEEEIGLFIKAIESGHKSVYPYTFKESLAHLRTLFALEKSARSNKFVSSF